MKFFVQFFFDRAIRKKLDFRVSTLIFCPLVQLILLEVQDTPGQCVKITNDFSDFYLLCVKKIS